MDPPVPTDFCPFIDRRIFIKEIPKLRYGVFAKEDIEENKFIEIAPVVVCEKTLIRMPNLNNYILSWNGNVAVPLGWTGIYNHSDKNNCDFSANYYDNLLGIVTNKIIKKGDQLTVNYGKTWFEERRLGKIEI